MRANEDDTPELRCSLKARVGCPHVEPVQVLLVVYRGNSRPFFSTLLVFSRLVNDIAYMTQRPNEYNMKIYEAWLTEGVSHPLRNSQPVVFDNKRAQRPHPSYPTSLHHTHSRSSDSRRERRAHVCEPIAKFVCGKGRWQFG